MDSWFLLRIFINIISRENDFRVRYNKNIFSNTFVFSFQYMPPVDTNPDYKLDFTTTMVWEFRLYICRISSPSFNI